MALSIRSNDHITIVSQMYFYMDILTLLAQLVRQTVHLSMLASNDVACLMFETL